MILINNGCIYTPARTFAPGVVTIEGERIRAVGSPQDITVPPGAEVINAGGRAVGPGFMGIHFYGCGGIAPSAGSGQALTALETIRAALARTAARLPRWGTTSFLISPMARPGDELRAHLSAIAECVGRTEGAELLGIHLEGPYLNPQRRGAFRKEWLREPDPDEARSYLDAAQGHIRLVTMAPELPRADEVARLFRQEGALPSLGHSTASYEAARRALDGDFSLVTHCFNAMTGFHHRQPGVVGAVLDSETATAMFICDGVHIHPVAVRLLVKVLGIDRLALVTDAIPGAGLGNGTYVMLGQSVTVREGRATLPDGTLAGSVLTMDRAVANVQAFTGLTLQEALKMATVNPARVLDLDHRKGRLAPGYDADIVVLEEDGRPWLTMARGRVVYRRGKDIKVPGTCD